MHLYYRFKADITDVVPIGLVPEGIRLDVYYAGSVVDGPLAGAKVQGIDCVLLRSDGVGVLDVRATLKTDQAENVAVEAHGYSLPPEGMPAVPPEVLLSPDFKWPDLPLALHGFALYRTGSPRLAELNSTALAFEGTANPGTAKLEISAHQLIAAAVA